MGAAQVPGRGPASGGYHRAPTPGAGHPLVTGPVTGPAAPGYGPAGAYPPAGAQPGPAQPTHAFASAGATTAVTASAEPPKKDLTVNKLVAGAGAAAVSAVLGSFFGAMGTVAGAAVGSVFSAVITAAMQHSLDRTRDTVKARVKLPGGKTVKVESTTEVPAPRGTADQASTRVFVTAGDQPTEVLSAIPAVDAGPPKSRRRLLVMTGFTVVVFAIGMLAITGIELVKGSPLNTTSSSSSSQRPGGTSLGSVLGKSASTATSTETATPSEGASDDPTSEVSTTEEPSNDEGSDSSAVPGTGFGANEQDATSTPTPTPSRGSSANDQSDQSDQSSQSGGGAAEQPGAGAGSQQ